MAEVYTLIYKELFLTNKKKMNTPVEKQWAKDRHMKLIYEDIHRRKTGWGTLVVLSNIGVITYAPTQIGPEFSLQEIQGQRLFFFNQS